MASDTASPGGRTWNWKVSGCAATPGNRGSANEEEHKRLFGRSVTIWAEGGTVTDTGGSSSPERDDYPAITTTPRDTLDPVSSPASVTAPAWSKLVGERKRNYKETDCRLIRSSFWRR